MENGKIATKCEIGNTNQFKISSTSASKDDKQPDAA